MEHFAREHTRHTSDRTSYAVFRAELRMNTVPIFHRAAAAAAQQQPSNSRAALSCAALTLVCVCLCVRVMSAGVFQHSPRI